MWPAAGMPAQAEPVQQPRLPPWPFESTTTPEVAGATHDSIQSGSGPTGVQSGSGVAGMQSGLGVTGKATMTLADRVRARSVSATTPHHAPAAPSAVSLPAASATGDYTAAQRTSAPAVLAPGAGLQSAAAAADGSAPTPATHAPSAPAANPVPQTHGGPENTDTARASTPCGMKKRVYKFTPAGKRAVDHALAQPWLEDMELSWRQVYQHTCMRYGARRAPPSFGKAPDEEQNARTAAEAPIVIDGDHGGDGRGADGACAAVQAVQDRRDCSAAVVGAADEDVPLAARLSERANRTAATVRTAAGGADCLAGNAAPPEEARGGVPHRQVYPVALRDMHQRIAACPAWAAVPVSIDAVVAAVEADDPIAALAQAVLPAAELAKFRSDVFVGDTAESGACVAPQPVAGRAGAAPPGTAFARVRLTACDGQHRGSMLAGTGGAAGGAAGSSASGRGIPGEHNSTRGVVAGAAGDAEGTMAAGAGAKRTMPQRPEDGPAAHATRCAAASTAAAVDPPASDAAADAPISKRQRKSSERCAMAAAGVVATESAPADKGTVLAEQGPVAAGRARYTDDCAQRATDTCRHGAGKVPSATDAAVEQAQECTRAGTEAPPPELAHQPAAGKPDVPVKRMGLMRLGGRRRQAEDEEEDDAPLQSRKASGRAVPEAGAWRRAWALRRQAAGSDDAAANPDTPPPAVGPLREPGSSSPARTSGTDVTTPEDPTITRPPQAWDGDSAVVARSRGLEAAPPDRVACTEGDVLAAHPHSPAHAPGTLPAAAHEIPRDTQQCTRRDEPGSPTSAALVPAHLGPATTDTAPNTCMPFTAIPRMEPPPAEPQRNPPSGPEAAGCTERTPVAAGAPHCVPILPSIIGDIIPETCEPETQPFAMRSAPLPGSLRMHSAAPQPPCSARCLPQPSPCMAAGATCRPETPAALRSSSAADSTAALGSGAGTRRVARSPSFDHIDGIAGRGCAISTVACSPVAAGGLTTDPDCIPDTPDDSCNLSQLDGAPDSVSRRPATQAAAPPVTFCTIPARSAPAPDDVMGAGGDGCGVSAIRVPCRVHDIFAMSPSKPLAPPAMLDTHATPGDNGPTGGSSHHFAAANGTGRQNGAAGLDLLRPHVSMAASTGAPPRTTICATSPVAQVASASVAGVDTAADVATLRCPGIQGSHDQRAPTDSGAAAAGAAPPAWTGLPGTGPNSTPTSAAAQRGEPQAEAAPACADGPVRSAASTPNCGAVRVGDDGGQRGAEAGAAAEELIDMTVDSPEQSPLLAGRPHESAALQPSGRELLDDSSEDGAGSGLGGDARKQRGRARRKRQCLDDSDSDSGEVEDGGGTAGERQ